MLAAMVAAGALLAAVAIFQVTGRQLQSGLDRLGADLLLVPRGQREAAERFLREGGALQVAGTAPVDAWKEQITKARVIGVEEMQPQGAALLIRLDGIFSPILAAQDVGKAVPDAEVVIAEQAARRVARDLQPLLRFLGPASAVAMLGAVLLTAMLTAIRVSERRGELGMLRAVGASRGWMIGLTLGEVGLIGVLGGTVGVLLAGGLLLWAAGGGLPVTELLLLALGALCITVVATGAAAIGPALKAAALDPLDAVRRP